MGDSKQSLDELIYSWIKDGHNSVDEILKLKQQYNLGIIEIVESLNRLEDYHIIKRNKDKLLISNSKKMFKNH